MRKFSFYFMLTAASVMALAMLTVSCSDPQERAVKELAGRISPVLAQSVDFNIVKHPADSADFYTLSSEKGRLVISGPDANSLAMGLGDYLRDWCHVTVTPYSYDEVTLPQTLPLPTESVTRKAVLKNRFFLNYCTYGYSLDWFKWEEWERMIDWMALNGVNMALANTGQESVWLDVWQQFGLSEQQIREYFVGPAYLSWHRMTNIDKWDSPLPYSWLDGQKALQKKIIAREASLGIRPILSCFTGHVPAALKDVYPEADMHMLSDWAGFPKDCFTWYLNPSDTLYRQIQKAFLKAQRKLYGKDCHIYGVDLFNEVDPPAWEAEYLARASKLTYEAMAEIDPEAVWLQMAWMFYYEKRWTPELIKAYITPVPKGRLLMLDYYCDNTEIYRRTENFYGQDFIWSFLGNFGGRTVINGDIKDISMKMDRVLAQAPGECSGVGCTLEGLDVNLQAFEYTLSRGWEKNCSDSLWVERLADRHLGYADEANREAWNILNKDILNGHIKKGTNLTARPSIKPRYKWSVVDKPYPNERLLDVWKLLVSVGPAQAPAFRFDCVNVARQCMSNLFRDLYLESVEAYYSGDAKLIAENHALMNSLMEDLDTLVASDRYFLLGKWVADARGWGASEEEKTYYETDARRILSTWGDKGKNLVDYANREWNGLISTYYAPRWDKFMTDLQAACEAGEEFDEKAFRSWSEEFEWEWATKPLSFTAEPQGDAFELSAQMLAKYENLIKR